MEFTLCSNGISTIEINRALQKKKKKKLETTMSVWPNQEDKQGIPNICEQNMDMIGKILTEVQH